MDSTNTTDAGRRDGSALERGVRPPGMYPKFDAATVTEFHKARKTNKTGFLGVRWDETNKRFTACIRVHGRKNKMYCGSGKTAEEAARKYDAKAIELYGPSAVTNFGPNVRVQPRSAAQQE